MKRLIENAFSVPQGLAGRIGGTLMALDKGLPAWVLKVLEVRPSDSLLEIASGPGVALALASNVIKEREIVGVDPSDTMLAMAQKRNRQAIADGRIRLYKGTVDQLPFNDSRFTVVFTINSVHLWPDPIKGITEMLRVLRPTGRIGLAISRFSYASPDKFGEYLIEFGIKDLQVHSGDRGNLCYRQVYLRAFPLLARCHICVL